MTDGHKTYCENILLYKLPARRNQGRIVLEYTFFHGSLTRWTQALVKLTIVLCLSFVSIFEVWLCVFIFHIAGVGLNGNAKAGTREVYVKVTERDVSWDGFH